MVSTQLRSAMVLSIAPLLSNCASQYVAPTAVPTAQLDLVSRVGGSPMFWHDDQNACQAEKLASFDDDSLQELGALVQGKQLHPVQSHELVIEAGRAFLLTATFGAARCSISYSFLPRAGEHYEADARGVCVVRIIHISKSPNDGASTRTFEPTAERIERPCANR